MTIEGYSKSKIIDELNARGCKTKVGSMSEANSIHSVLTNEKYTGVYLYNKTAKKMHSARETEMLIKIQVR